MKKLIHILIIAFAFVVVGCSKSELANPMQDLNQKSLSDSDAQIQDIQMFNLRGGSGEDGSGGISDDEDDDDDDGKRKKKNSANITE